MASRWGAYLRHRPRGGYAKHKHTTWQQSLRSSSSWRYRIRAPIRAGRSVLAFTQRGRRGYANSDVWGLNSYLAATIPHAIEHMLSNLYGYPSGLEYDAWRDALANIADGFRAFTEMDSLTYQGRSAEEYQHQQVELTARVSRGLDLFALYFLDLWD